MDGYSFLILDQYQLMKIHSVALRSWEFSYHEYDYMNVSS